MVHFSDQSDAPLSGREMTGDTHTVVILVRPSRYTLIFPARIVHIAQRRTIDSKLSY